MLRPASASLSQPQPLGPRFRSTGHIGLVFDILRKLFALEKQSPLGAYLSAAELGRRVYSCVHVHGVCMTCACRVHGTCMAWPWHLYGVCMVCAGWRGCAASCASARVAPSVTTLPSTWCSMGASPVSRSMTSRRPYNPGPRPSPSPRPTHRRPLCYYSQEAIAALAGRGGRRSSHRR